MPEVVLVEGGVVAVREVVARGQRFEHGEVAGLRLVEAGEQAVDDFEAALWVDDEARPAFARVADAMLVGDGFEGAHDGGAYGDDAAMVGAGSVDDCGGVAGHAIPFFVGRLVRFEASHAGVQDQRDDNNALGDQFGKQFGREGATRRGHFGAAQLGGVDGLVVIAGPGLLHIAIADWCAKIV